MIRVIVLIVIALLIGIWPDNLKLWRAARCHPVVAMCLFGGHSDVCAIYGLPQRRAIDLTDANSAPCVFRCNMQWESCFTPIMNVCVPGETNSACTY